LKVYADTVLALTVPGERFQTIAGQTCEISQRNRDLHSIEFQTRRTLDSLKGFDPFAGREIPRAPIPIAEDQF
jgi:hypothetical protein